jgi:TM2 domain-containing membrane protein YozV
MKIKRNPYLAALLSIPVPGLGQIYAGKGERGAAILIAAIIVGNLNAIWLSIYAAASPGINAFWAQTLPRILHDLFAAYGVIFLIWQVADAYQLAKSPHH